MNEELKIVEKLIAFLVYVKDIIDTWDGLIEIQQLKEKLLV